MNWRDLKIKVYASKKDLLRVESLLDALELIGDEYKDRLIIQDAIDANCLKVDILYDGNIIVSKTRILKELNKIFKKKPSEYWNMSDYLYNFLHNNCGSIAHYDKHGWICEYPTVGDLKQFFNKNEWGQNILQYQPSWKSDCRVIAEEILSAVNKAISLKDTKSLKENNINFKNYSNFHQISLFS